MSDDHPFNIKIKPKLWIGQPLFEYETVPYEELNPLLQDSVAGILAHRDRVRQEIALCPMLTGGEGYVLTSGPLFPQNLIKVMTAKTIMHLDYDSSLYVTFFAIAFGSFGLGALKVVMTSVIKHHRAAVQDTKDLSKLIESMVANYESPYGARINSYNLQKYNRGQIDNKGNIVLEVDPHDVRGIKHQQSGLKKLIARASYCQPCKRTRFELEPPRQMEKQRASPFGYSNAAKHSL